jgi:hypothetical protein
MMTLNCSRIGRYILLGTTAALAGLSTSAARGQASVEILSPPDNAQLTVKMTDLMLVVYVKFQGTAFPGAAVAKLNYVENGMAKYHQSSGIPQGVQHPDYGACWKMEIPIEYKNYTGAVLEVVTVDTATMMAVVDESTNITITKVP